MRLAFSSNAYLRYSFPEAARRIAAIGYEGIEVMADVPHAWPAFLLDEQKETIRRAVKDNGLQIANVNAFMMNAVNDHRQRYWHPSWIEPDPNYRRVRIDHTRRALDLAKEIGASCITTEPGGPLAEGQPWEVGLRIFLDSLLPVARHAQEIGIDLLVEPEPELLIENSAQFETFMEFVDIAAVGLNFDVGHFYCVRDDPVAALKRLATHIRHVHLEDIAATRKHHHLIPGDGAIDIPAVLRTLSEIGYNGWVTIELYPYVDDPDLAARTARERVLPYLPR
jgi:sugar phosphate isomerase/epimerase